ncbi:hypothetical protein RIVM261_040400 [Rivularia sp. IAM M-261]|nr:hypothetical protein RIVM261_040400 [Rivularia sp. IAM M-261]
MLISCITEDGQAHSQQITSLLSLSEFLDSYIVTNYNLKINQVNYNVVKTGKCGKQEYPKIALQKNGYILPTELVLTQIYDLEYFINEHVGNIYRLELDSNVYQMSR